MINLVWLLLLVGGSAVAMLTGKVGGVTEAAMVSAKQSIETGLGLMGVMALWTGVLRIAEKAQLIEALARRLRPILGRLFPGVPPDHPALTAITMNLSANALGVGGAATPFGLRAMTHLQELNPDPETATPAMCTFLAINTSSVTLIPATVIAIRALSGSRDPAEIIVSTLVATITSTTVALTLDYFYRRRLRLRSGVV